MKRYPVFVLCGYCYIGGIQMRLGKDCLMYAWRLYRSYVIACGLMLGVMLVGIPAFTTPLKYHSENRMSGSRGTSDENLTDTSYNFYLDISPTMWGFCDGYLNGLAASLEAAGSDKQNKAFYFCGEHIYVTTEALFFEGMQNRTVFNRYLGDGEGSWDLSGIFTSYYDDGESQLKEQNAVNIIISDFNFYRNSADAAQHNNNMERFANNLAQYASSQDICIYNISSRVNGPRFDNLQTTGNTVDDMSSVLMIVFSDNEVAFENAVGQLEQQLIRNGVDISEKVLLKNDPLKNYEKPETSRSLFRSDHTSLHNFNFNSQWFERVDGQAIGLQLIRGGEGTTASVRTPVFPLDIPGYYDNPDENNTRLQTNVEVFSAGLFGYEKADTEAVVRNCQAAMEYLDENWYVILNLEIDKDACESLPGSRRYGVVDVRFSLDVPDYTIPDWVEQMNAESYAEGTSKKVGIRSLFEAVYAAKERFFEGAMTSFQKQIGNIQVYISY